MYPSGGLKKRNKHIALICLILLHLLPARAQRIPAPGRSGTLEMACWNTEWFGKTTPGYGPDNDSLQQDLVQKVIQASEIDIWGLCEISDSAAFKGLLRKLPAYGGTLAPYLPEQKTAILYQTAAYRFLYGKTIGKRDSFSTMRLPYEVALLPNSSETAVDTLFLIVLHLKSNTGNDSQKLDAYKSRQKSAAWLSGYLQTFRKNNYCVVLGDWNDDVDVSVFSQLPSPFASLEQETGFLFSTKKLSRDSIRSMVFHKDPVDHHLISPKLQSLYLKDSVFSWKLDKHIPQYASQCSDHYPVYTLFAENNLHLPESTSEAPQVYPNPVSGTLYLKGITGKAVLELYDCRGIRQAGFHMHESSGVDVTGLSTGLYTAMIKTGGQIYFRKISIAP